MNVARARRVWGRFGRRLNGLGQQFKRRHGEVPMSDHMTMPSDSFGWPVPKTHGPVHESWSTSESPLGQREYAPVLPTQLPFNLLVISVVKNVFRRNKVASTSGSAARKRSSCSCTPRARANTKAVKRSACDRTRTCAAMSVCQQLCDCKIQFNKLVLSFSFWCILSSVGRRWRVFKTTKKSKLLRSVRCGG